MSNKDKTIKPDYETATNTPEWYLQKAIAFRKEQDFANSILALRAGIKQHPESAMLFDELGQRLRGQKNDKDDDEALHRFKTAMTLDPQKIEYALNYTDLLTKRGKVAEAEQILLPLYNPDEPRKFPNSVVLPELAQAYKKMGRYDLAVACCGQCLEIRPEHKQMRGVMKFLNGEGFTYDSKQWVAFLDYAREKIAVPKDVDAAPATGPGAPANE